MSQMRNLAQRLKRRFTAASDTPSAANGKARASPGGRQVSNDNDDLELDEREYTKEDLLEPVPSFREVPQEKRKALFIRKLRLCSITYDFRDESPRENMGKEVKRQLLLELVDYITTGKGWYSEGVVDEILGMVSANLFRSFAPMNNANFDPDEDEPILDTGWPHLQVVYEFLLRFIMSSEPDSKVVKRRMQGQFICNLLAVFKSEDPREREYLKTILHRIYGKYMSLRSTIRRLLNNVFYQVIYASQPNKWSQDERVASALYFRHNGISELLEILGSIINGFALPLKEEHKNFLRNVLIPLHKIPVNKLQIFHEQLSYCITQFIDKDNSLALVIIGGLLKFWPVTSSSKSVLLLNELEEILELTPTATLEPFVAAIFARLARCIENEHFQVAERALFYWNNDLISGLTANHKSIVYPIMVPALRRMQEGNPDNGDSKGLCASHWNPTVHSLCLNVIRIFMEIDSELYAAHAYNGDLKAASRLEEQLNQDHSLSLGMSKSPMAASETADGEMDPSQANKTDMEDSMSPRKESEIDPTSEQRAQKWKRIHQIAQQNSAAM